ncbi:NACHT domain-containing protein [Amycolatopsis sp. CA-161197]|uniref:NACHT domain-containing protein n=1 Tax=Amycolatopsis sp. CA-161197 TaxID=3239922 RepID=UPI003D9200EF
MLKVGEAVAKQVALQWLAEKKAAGRRGRDLALLVRARFPLRRQERDVLAALTSIEDDVAERLTPGLTDAAHGLAENEREAALAAVADALLAADLSDTGLFAADLDPSALATAVRAQWPVARAALSSPAERLFEIGLDRACVVLTHLVRELPEFNAAVGVEQLRRLRAVLDGIDRVLDRLPSRELGAPEGTDFDAQFRRRYLDRVVRSYERLEVIGLTAHSYEPRTTLSVAYLSLTVTADAERAARRPRDRGVPGRLGDDPGARQATDNIRVEAALGGSRLTVIRGEAGAGKSTLLRWLAVNAARSAFTDQLAGWNGCVPFLVKLRDFADGPLPRGDELLTQPSSPPWGPAPREWVHRRLESGEALVLVDGVDELVATRRAAVRTWLRDLLAGYPDIRVVVTSRPTAVTSKWLLAEGFRSVVLEPMSAADVQVFLRRWHAALLDSTSAPDLLPCRPEEVPEHQRVLLAQLQARPHLRALARSPLLCAMVCALNLDRRARLPRDRLALYSAALDMLLERRDADRNVSAGDDIQATVAEKLALLRALAWWLNENGRTEMSREQALARISSRLRGMPGVSESADVLLDHLIERSGVIRQPVAGRVDFIHRTFQEFLAAGEAVDRDSIDLLVSHARSDLWRETVLMACAQASPDQRGRLLSGILAAAASASARTARQLLLLAAACRETAVLAPPEVLARVDTAVRGLVPPRSVRESRSLATVGESILDYLPKDLADLSAAQAAACVRTAALVNGPAALETLAVCTRPALEGPGRAGGGLEVLRPGDLRRPGSGRRAPDPEDRRQDRDRLRRRPSFPAPAQEPRSHQGGPVGPRPRRGGSSRAGPVAPPRGTGAARRPGSRLAPRTRQPHEARFPVPELHDGLAEGTPDAGPADPPRKPLPHERRGSRRLLVPGRNAEPQWHLPGEQLTRRLGLPPRGTGEDHRHHVWPGHEHRGPQDGRRVTDRRQVPHLHRMFGPRPELPGIAPRSQRHVHPVLGHRRGSARRTSVAALPDLDRFPGRGRPRAVRRSRDHHPAGARNRRGERRQARTRGHSAPKVKRILPRRPAVREWAKASS